MARQPITSGIFQGLDANGNLAAGGKLYVYAAGTTTPLPTYADSTTTSAHANPIILDGNGQTHLWLPNGLTYKFVLTDSADQVLYTEDNIPTPAVDSSSSASNDASVVSPGGRLSLVSNDFGPPSTAGASTLYYVPCRHDKIPLYDGSAWALYSIGEGLSQSTTDNTKSPSATAADKVYDVFVWYDSAADAVRLSRGPAWTSDIDRGSGAGTSEIGPINGRLVNLNSITNGPAARCGLYVGSVSSDDSALLNDTTAVRHVWNNYNRILRYMSVTDPAATWVYTTATWRQANANTANSLNFLVGVAEDEISARVQGSANNSSATPAGAVAIGVDSTSVPSGPVASTPLQVGFGDLSAAYDGLPGRGRHYLAWLEFSGAAGTTTWSGAAALNGFVSGITGRLLA